MATAETITPPPTEQRNRHRRWIFTVAAVAALTVVGAVVVVTRDDAAEVSASSEDTAETAEEIAEDFLDAYRRFDADQAASYLAPDALLTTYAGPEGLAGELRWSEASGYQLLPGSCQEQDTTSSGTTVRCPYEFHGIRSAEAGLGPYGDNFYDFTVLEGKIVWLSDNIAYLTNGFSSEMWEPFASWVRENHPEDVPVMYSSFPRSTHEASRTAESLRLWELRSQEYVQQLSDGADADTS